MWRFSMRQLWIAGLLLLSLAALMALGAVLPNHPWDLLYNGVVRHVTGTPPLPRAGWRRRLTFALGVVWLGFTAWAFASGRTAPWQRWSWSRTMHSGRSRPRERRSSPSVFPLPEDREALLSQPTVEGPAAPRSQPRRRAWASLR